MEKRIISKNITQNYKTNTFVDVFPLTSVDSSFTYILDTTEPNSFLGYRVVIPFKNRKIIGIIYKEHKEPLEFDAVKLKKIIKIIDDKPVISEQMLILARWIADYYVTPIGEVLQSIIPPKLKIAEKKYVQFLGVSEYEKEILSKSERKVVDYLSNQKKPVLLETLKANVRSSRLNNTIENLSKKGIIRIIQKEKGQIPKKQIFHINTHMFSDEIINEYFEIFKKKKNLLLILQRFFEISSSGIVALSFEEIKKEFPRPNLNRYLNTLVEIGFLNLEFKNDTETSSSFVNKYNFPNELTLQLTSEQENTLNSIINALEGNRFASFLLYGVTGSGKTLVYLHSIKKCLQKGKSAIMLVPEISLTPQLVERFNNAFPEQIAVLHSRLTESERVKQWVSILNGEKRIVIGARSAIFAPTKNLGLIIVDEEHEPTYKQDEPSPRYNARDVALMRGKIENAIVVLGSATPSVNSYYASKIGKHSLLKISERVDGAKLPNIILVDMLEKRKQRRIFGQFSDTLLHKIIDRLNKKEGIILFQNRRGFGLLVECRFCGYIPKCPECEVSLTFHKSEHKLKCHYCGFEREYDATCPKCGKTPMLVLGYGTQRIEEELQSILNELEYFPKIERFDLDVVIKSTKGNEILQKFYFGEIDILVGTQLIAKGLDFERVTLVGIVNADLQLNIPDYSANERAFQLFTQVAGRAGRRSNLPGEVIIQTTNPNVYPIESFVNNDYESFYKKEIYFRRTLHYPPFYRLISIEIRWKNQALKEEIINFLKGYLEQINNSILLGPVVPIIPKIRGWNRKIFLLKINRQKDPNLLRTTSNLKNLYYEFQKKFHQKNLNLIIDVDAQFSLF